MKNNIVDLGKTGSHFEIFRQKASSHSIKVIKAIEGQLRDVAFEIGDPWDKDVTWENGS